MRLPRVLMAIATAAVVTTTRQAVAAVRVGLMRSRTPDLLSYPFDLMGTLSGPQTVGSHPVRRTISIVLLLQHATRRGHCGLSSLKIYREVECPLQLWLAKELVRPGTQRWR